MAVDKRISVEPNEVGIGSIKRKKVEVIPFKPKPDSPFATPEGIFDLPKPKPEAPPVMRATLFEISIFSPYASQFKMRDITR